MLCVDVVRFFLSRCVVVLCFFVLFFLGCRCVVAISVCVLLLCYGCVLL